MAKKAFCLNCGAELPEYLFLQQENAELKEKNTALEETLQTIEQLKDEDSLRITQLVTENEKLKEENVKLLFDKGTLLEFCNKLTQIIDEKKENENKLLQTLQEIKKECHWVSECGVTNDNMGGYDNILDKINEVLND